MEMPGYQSNLSVKQRAQARRRARKQLALAQPLGPHVRLALQWGMRNLREARIRKDDVAAVAAANQSQVLIAVARLLDEGIADPSVDRICIQLGLPWSKRIREHDVIPCLMKLERDGVLAFRIRDTKIKETNVYWMPPLREGPQTKNWKGYFKSGKTLRSSASKLQRKPDPSIA
jgi:hypothetical protein